MGGYSTPSNLVGGQKTLPMRLGIVEETRENMNANVNNDEVPLEEESEEVDNELLTDTIAAENERE